MQYRGEYNMTKATPEVNGNIYGLSGIHTTKAEAQEQAHRFQSRGFNAVVKKSMRKGKTMYKMYSTDS
jgi:hypothetical protein